MSQALPYMWIHTGACRGSGWQKIDVPVTAQEILASAGVAMRRSLVEVMLHDDTMRGELFAVIAEWSKG